MSENDDYMNELASAIYDEAEEEGEIYEELSVVFKFEDDGFQTSTFGALYTNDKRPIPFAPGSFEVSGVAERYWKFLKHGDQPGPAAMLFQFNILSKRVNLELEYDNRERWDYDLDNAVEKREEIRPNLY